MAKKPGTETVVVVRTPKVDILDDAPTGTPPEHEIDGCAVMPRTSYEEESGWVIVEGRMVVAPFGADITADDRVRVPDSPELWDVDGEPGEYKNRRGKGKATIFYLKRLGT